MIAKYSIQKNFICYSPYRESNKINKKNGDGEQKIYKEKIKTKKKYRKIINKVINESYISCS